MNLKRTFSLGLLCVLLLASFLFTGCSSVKKDSPEQLAAEILIACSSQFKSPQSVRMASGSGTLYRSENGYAGGFLYATVSAKNGWGTPVTDRYILFLDIDTGDGYVIDEETAPSSFSDRSKFTSEEIDVSVVNQIMTDYWKDRGLFFD